MNTIIAPTDFSPVSLNAVNYAADMAMAINASLLILHATELPFDKKFSSALEDCEAESEEKLIELQKKLIKRTKNKIKIDAKQVSGIIENELIKMCDYKEPFVVVMATHGSSLRKLFFIGSITVHLSRNLKYPVIVVPGNVHFKPVHDIALATDLKNIDDLPIEKISAVVNAFNAKLSVVHVNSGKQNFEESSVKVHALYNYLKHLNPEFQFIYNSTVQRGIISFAKKNNIDMILAFPKKHAFFHSSESKQLIFNSPVTVMTLQ
jgi:nucleotide-binding universal stress UspA family protein